MPTRFLNEEEKQDGRRRMFRAEIFNGFSAIFLGDTLVFLLAAHFNAGNLIMGIISAALYASGIAVPFIIPLFDGHHQEHSHGFCWMMRGVFCLGYIGLFFLQGAPAVALLLGTYLMYCLFRSLGIVFNDLSAKNVSSINNRGAVLSRFSTAFQCSSLAAKVISALVTGIRALSALTGIIGLQMAGILANSISSVDYARIPCRRTVEQKRVPLGALWKKVFADPRLWLPIVLRSVFICALIIVQMAVPFMSRVLGLGDTMVLVYSVAAAVGLVSSSMVMRRLSDRIGAKPLVLLNTVMITIVLAAWIVLPPTAPVALFFALGFLANFFINCINLMTSKMVTAIIPEDDPVGFSTFVTFFIAFCAVGVGIGAGYAVDLGVSVLGSSSLPLLGNTYSFCFLLALILCIGGYVLTLFVTERHSLSAARAAQAIFSMHGLQAFSMIDRIEKTKDPLRRRILLLSLGNNLTGVATDDIRRKLYSPFSPDKVEIIHALGDHPRPALVKDLALIAQDDDSYTQLDAIGALGGYIDDPTARQALEQLLNSRWGASRSMASKSLSRFSDSYRYLDQVNALSLKASHIDEEIDFLIAKRNMDREGLFYRDFFLPVRNGRSWAYRQTRYALIASFLKFGSPRLTQLYELMNIGTCSDFLDDFLPEARDLEDIDGSYDEIYSAFARSDSAYIRSFCLEMVRRSSVSYDSRLENLKQGLLAAADIDIGSFDVQDMLALLYFGYSLRKVSR